MSNLSHVAVVGLLPAQARRIADHFPKSGLKFVPKEREREVGEITASLDRVVVMTKFISHSTWYSVPREKILPVNGGLTELRRKLLKIAAPDAAKIPAQPARVLDMPATDYQAIKTAKPGEVLLFPRPEHTTKTAFEKQVSAMRSYYKRTHGIETEQRSTEKGVEIVVNGTLASAQDAAPVERPAPETADFWMQAYLRFISACPGADDDGLASRADAAVTAFQARFGDS